MREILFKAKKKNWRGLLEDEQWVEGYYAKLGKGDLIRHYIIQNCALVGLFDDPEANMYFNDVEIDPETLCQYTGLKDKNGKRIWENDILQNARNNDLYTVKWHGSFGMYVWSKRKENNKHIFDYGDLYLMNRKCVVIGNIFDNPELLKGE